MLNTSLSHRTAHNESPLSREHNPWPLRGTYTALVTPFREAKSGTEIDYPALERLIGQQVRYRCGIVLLGTTGESPTIEPEEREGITAFCRHETAGLIPLIVGTGTNSTRETVLRTKQARDQGADAALVVTPYYNKPTQTGLRKHFEAVANAVTDLSSILYDVPGRCGTGMTAETVLELSQHPNIIGLKWASGDSAQLRQIVRQARPDFSVLSGDDNRTHEAMQEGVCGIISVLSNLLPADVRELVDCHLRAQEEHRDSDRMLCRAATVHEQLLPLMQGCFLQSNPLPIKTALAVRGDIQEVFRLPLCPMDPEPRTQWINLLECKGALSPVHA